MKSLVGMLFVMAILLACGCGETTQDEQRDRETQNDEQSNTEPQGDVPKVVKTDVGLRVSYATTISC